jgi:putative transposase
MQFIEPLICGNFYHIYNRGIDSCDFFHDNNNYEYFLGLYDKFISPVADTYAWVLMKNHFHFLVRIRENVVYKYSNTNADRFEEVKWQTINLSASEGPDSVKKTPKPHLHFSHLFNAYSKYFNKRYNRHGSLFERSFKRKLIDNRNYLRQVILYIHNNPVHHGFCSHPIEYSWSSYLTCITSKPTKLQRKEVIDLFIDSVQFKKVHDERINYDSLEKWLEM